jgi:hypothetical protein
MLENIPDLRKISMSPWSKLDEAREKISGRYIMSVKPNPTTLAMQPFSEQVVRDEINGILDSVKNNPAEIILKDISTVKNEPFRLKKWNDIVMVELHKQYS